MEPLLSIVIPVPAGIWLVLSAGLIVAIFKW